MPDIEKAKSWYPDDDPVHGFAHIQRVYSLAEHLARVEGADLEIVRAAALLHDADGGASGAGTPEEQAVSQRLAHHQAAAIFADQVLKAEGWTVERIEAVQHCIRAHRFRDNSEQPESIEAKVLFDADKLDAIGATGVARAVAYAARAGQPFFSPPSEQFLTNGERAPGEAHSAYHEFLFKLRALKERMYTSSGRVLAQERHNFMQTFFERLDAEAAGQA